MDKNGRAAVHGTPPANNVIVDSYMRHHQDWIVPRRVMCAFFWTGIILLFTGIILLVTSKHKGDHFNPGNGGSSDSDDPVTPSMPTRVYRSWGGVLLGLGFCLLLICLILCLHAYCVITINEDELPPQARHVPPPHPSTLVNGRKPPRTPTSRTISESDEQKAMLDGHPRSLQGQQSHYYIIEKDQNGHKRIAPPGYFNSTPPSYQKATGMPNGTTRPGHSSVYENVVERAGQSGEEPDQWSDRPRVVSLSEAAVNQLELAGKNNEPDSYIHFDSFSENGAFLDDEDGKDSLDNESRQIRDAASKSPRSKHKRKHVRYAGEGNTEENQQHTDVRPDSGRSEQSAHTSEGNKSEDSKIGMSTNKNRSSDSVDKLSIASSSTLSVGAEAASKDTFSQNMGDPNVYPTFSAPSDGLLQIATPYSSPGAYNSNKDVTNVPPSSVHNAPDISISYPSDVEEMLEPSDSIETETTNDPRSTIASGGVSSDPSNTTSSIPPRPPKISANTPSRVIKPKPLSIPAMSVGVQYSPPCTPTAFTTASQPHQNMAYPVPRYQTSAGIVSAGGPYQTTRQVSSLPPHISSYQSVPRHPRQRNPHSLERQFAMSRGASLGESGAHARPSFYLSSFDNTSSSDDMAESTLSTYDNVPYSKEPKTKGHVQHYHF